MINVTSPRCGYLRPSPLYGLTRGVHVTADKNGSRHGIITGVNRRTFHDKAMLEGEWLLLLQCLPADRPGLHLHRDKGTKDRPLLCVYMTWSCVTVYLEPGYLPYIVASSLPIHC